MKLNNKTYNFLKWFVLIATPVFITFISTLGALFGHDVTLITGVVGATSALIGGLIGASTKTYKNVEKINLDNLNTEDFEKPVKFTEDGIRGLLDDEKL